MRLIRKLIPLAVISIVLVVLASQVQAQTPVGPGSGTGRIPVGLNFENLFSYTPLQHGIIAHVLTLGYATQAAGFAYFVTTSNNIAPRYRL